MVPFLFFLAAVDFLLRMDFVMLVLVLSLSPFFVCRFKKKKKRDKGKGLRFGGCCGCPLVMIINKNNYENKKTRCCDDTLTSAFLINPDTLAGVFFKNPGDEFHIFQGEKPIENIGNWPLQ